MAKGTGWIVKIAAGYEAAAASVYGARYFPRKYHYQSEAVYMRRELAAAGIKATVEKSTGRA